MGVNEKGDEGVSHPVTQSALYRLNGEVFESVAQADVSVLLLPGRLVRSMVLPMPKLSAAQLEAAVKYALEPYVSDPVDRFIIRYQRMDDKKSVLLWWMHEDDYQHCLGCAKASSIQYVYAVPDYMALPYHANGWTIHYDIDRVLYRQSQGVGGACSLQSWCVVFSRLFEEASEKPTDVYVSGANDHDWSECHSLVLSHGIECQRFESLEWIQPAPFLLSMSLLRKGDGLKPKRNGGGLIHRLWFLLLVIVIVTSALHAWSSWSYYSRSLYKVQSDTQTLYAQFFPDLTWSNGGRARVQQVLGNINTQGHQDFSRLLLLVGPIIRKQQGVQLKQLSFDEGVLTARLQLSDSTQVKTILHDCTATGVDLLSNQVKALNKGVQLTIECQLKGAL